MAKITKATFKSFVNKTPELLFCSKSSFDGMVDGCVAESDRAFRPVSKTTNHVMHTYGIAGAWLVGNGGDRFYAYDDGVVEGIEVYNSCGNFIVGKQKR